MHIANAPAFTNLTTEYCAGTLYVTVAFNKVTLDDPNVHYASYAATANVTIRQPLQFAHRIVSEREGENDGKSIVIIRISVIKLSKMVMADLMQGRIQGHG